MTESGNHSKMLAIVLFLFFPSSLKSAIWNTVPLKYNRATDGCDVWNVPECSYTAGDIGTRQENHPNQVSFALKANRQLWPGQI